MTVNRAAAFIGLLGILILVFGYLFQYGATLEHIIPDLLRKYRH